MNDNGGDSSVVELYDLVAGHNENPVIKVNSLCISRSEVVAIVGPSGSGKSTLLSTIAGALKPISGTLKILGEQHTEDWRLKNTARTLQNFPLLHWLTVGGNLRLAARTRGFKLTDAKEILTQFHAEHLEHRYVTQLSGGERCRASIAQAIVAANNPAVVLLDEPFTGLDFRMKSEAANTLFEFAEFQKTPVLFVTHDLVDAKAYSDRIIVLQHGTPTTIGMECSADAPNALEQIYKFLGGNRDVL